MKNIKNITDDTICFILNQLKEFQPRDDYKELLNLPLIFLGGIPEFEVSFRACGFFHRVRWMSKAIYCLQIHLFRNDLSQLKAKHTQFEIFIYIPCENLCKVLVCNPISGLGARK